MSALTIYNPNKSKITATSSAITLKGKKKNIVLSKKEEKSEALVKMSGKESSLVTKSKLVSGGKGKNSLKEKLSENNKKIISITKSINKKNNLKIKSAKTDIKAVKAEEPAKQKEETEKVLEDRPEEKKAKKEGPSIPIPKKPSLFDRLFQYLALTGLNWVVGKLSNQKLGLAGFFNNLQSVIENIVEWFPKFLDGTFAVVEAIGPFVVGTGQFLFDVFVGALDLAYGAYDGIRQTIGNLFGEEAKDQFDNFATKINEFAAISAAIGTALLLTSKVLAAHGPCLGKGRKKSKGRNKGKGRGGDTSRDSRNPRGTNRRGVTTSGGRRTGIGGVVDRISEMNPFRRRSNITTSGGRRTGFGGIMDRLGEMNPFRKKPKITGSTGPNIFQRMGDSVGGFARRTGETIATGARRVVEGVQFLAEGASKQYRKALSGLSGIKDNVIRWGSKGIDNTFQWMSKQKGLLGRIGSAMPDFLQRVGKYIPFAGDAIGFVMDLMGGVDWRRALIRALIGAGIDAGFTATLSALGLAAPFTGGASGIAATALLAAYMTADFAAGGFGRIVGDKVSDALGIPEKAGERGDAPAPNAVPPDSKIEEIIASIENDERYSKVLEKESQSFTLNGKEVTRDEYVNSDLWKNKLYPSIIKQLKGDNPTLRDIAERRLRNAEYSQDHINRLKEGYNKGGRVKIGAQDFRDLAYIVSGEAARGTNDEYGVAAAVLNRVASPVWPSTVKQVGSQSGQFEAVYTGKAKDEPELAEKLASAKGQASIASAMRLLNGRTDFKGQSMLANKGSTDIMFHRRGNFFHYTSQRAKKDPAPTNPDQSWKRLIGFGGPKIDLKTTTSSAQTMGTGEGSGGSGEQKDGSGINSILDNPLMKLFKQLNIGGSGGSSADIADSSDKPKPSSVGDVGDGRDKKTKPKSGGGISSIGSSSKPSSPAQISSSPSSSLSSTKTNITKASQSLSYEKPKPNTKISVIIKEKTTQVIT